MTDGQDSLVAAVREFRAALRNGEYRLMLGSGAPLTRTDVTRLYRLMRAMDMGILAIEREREELAQSLTGRQR